MELLLFAHPDDPQPSQVIAVTSRTLFYWHVFVEGLAVGSAYAYRVDGPATDEETRRYGHRFNRNKVLIDPYAKGNFDQLWDATRARDSSDNVATSMRSMVIDLSDYDWEGDVMPNTSRADTVLYEMHVRGFTASPTSGVAQPGTYAGLIEKLPYVKQLGVTAIELMPVFDFDARAPKRHSPTTGEPLRNFWGYDPITFFAPHSEYCVAPGTAGHVREFRDLVKAAHRLGLEVILDVVYNHTGEDDQNGPVISFKGIDNNAFYFLQSPDRHLYRSDLTGCPNAVKCNHPFVTKMVTESLAYWVSEMHVDGFRFDLGAVLTLGEDARRLEYPPVVWALNLDERFANIKVIIEPFGGNQGDILGALPNLRSTTWNYRYKNAIRHFVRGDRGMIGEMATRIAGSSDIFQWPGAGPLNGVSYAACHDGFTLNDVVSYNQKYNAANAEESGDQDNTSRNYGAEGPTEDPAIEATREKQLRNFLAIVFLSQGLPMILAGDECRRTQQGNNNPYIQDNEVSWFDWALVDKHAALVEFTRSLITFRKRHTALRRQTFFTGLPSQRGLLDIAFHGCTLHGPGFADPSSRVLAFTLSDPGEGEDLHVILNMEETGLAFQIPEVVGRKWHRAIDTVLPAPETISAPGKEPLITTEEYDAAPQSCVVLVSKAPPIARR